MSELQKQILELPVHERLQLISFIASSISPDEVHIPQAWIDEALARDEAFQKGNTQALSWEEAKRKVHGGQ